VSASRRHRFFVADHSVQFENLLHTNNPPPLSLGFRVLDEKIELTNLDGYDGSS
jgi:hypothetical protein